MSETPLNKGEMFECKIKEEPTIIDAKTIAKEIRLLICSPQNL
jgi:hypothetical protein